MDIDRVRQRAYEIWQQEGQPEGKQQEHWEQAMREVGGGQGEGQGAPGEDMQSGAGLQSGADDDKAMGSISDAAGAMREASGGPEVGAAEGTDADQFGKQAVEPGVQDETGGGA
ncbi:DUF2934 domain-containing protein [Skermanella sp. TT6]|uniref:DUF2934 domain-containing protein n=1 Tax=Skermanella cutis TaxID=2775420 RepID=A0ABX7BAC0_9PROT|nr:DUF2934 domain-containing protein [Skermanella sp. TT6]QQP91122.1 DUF2934 domain-containing protein [Skermanella sp. TT6]